MSGPPQPKTGKRKKPGQSTKQNRDVADRKWSLVVRSRGFCQLATAYDTPCAGDHQAAHIIPRRWSATRTMEENGLCACLHHHHLFDAFPGDQARIVDDLELPYDYATLRAMAHAGIQGRTPLIFWREERARLTRLAEDIT